MPSGSAPKAKPSGQEQRHGQGECPLRRQRPQASSSWVWSPGSPLQRRSRTKAQAGSPDPLPLHARLSPCARPCQAGRPCRQGPGIASAQDLLCAEALAVEIALLEGVGIAQAKGTYARARRKSGNMIAKGTATCDEHPAFDQARHFPGAEDTGIAVESLGPEVVPRSTMALLSEQA